MFNCVAALEDWEFFCLSIMGEVPREIINLHKQCQDYIIILRENHNIKMCSISYSSRKAPCSFLVRLVYLYTSTVIFIPTIMLGLILYCHFSLSP